MKTIGSSRKIVVSSDGQGIICQAGGLLLVEALRVSGLAQGLSQALSGWRRPRAVHVPGKIIRCGVLLTLGGDCLEDVAACGQALTYTARTPRFTLSGTPVCCPVQTDVQAGEWREWRRLTGLLE